MKAAAASFVALGLIVAASLAAWGFDVYGRPGPLAEEKIVLIAPGTSVRGIYDVLLLEGAARPGFGKYVFLAAAKIRKANLKAGEYDIPPASSLAEIITILESGKVHQHSLTIPEGLTVAETIALINANRILQGEITETPKEGMLLPETYHFTRGEKRATLLARMQKSLEQELAILWESRDETLPYKTPEEALTMASIIEKETAVPSERARVAGVFLNRLKINMPLQSDPTVIYAVTGGKQALGRSLKRKDLETASPYNTYKVTGLPPGPIANPGRASLHAAFNPESHGYFYFVADGRGGHAFAVTLAEHNANVAAWLKILKEQRKSQ